MHLPRFCPALAALTLLTLAPSRGLADEPAAAPGPVAATATTTPAEGVAAIPMSDTESKLAGALRSFTLVQNENDDLKAQNDKLTAEKSALAAELAAAKTALPIAAQAEGLREQLRQTQGQLAVYAEENARLRTALALAGPAPGALAAPEPSRAVPPPPMPAKAEPMPAATARTYTVAAGDTLTRISQKFYGTPSRWPEILAANKPPLKDEKGIFVGQTIKIP